MLRLTTTFLFILLPLSLETGRFQAPNPNLYATGNSNLSRRRIKRSIFKTQVPSGINVERDLLKLKSRHNAADTRSVMSGYRNIMAFLDILIYLQIS